MDDDGLTKDSTPEYYKEIPVSALRHTAQHEISLHLNLPTLRGVCVCVCEQRVCIARLVIIIVSQNQLLTF